MVSKLSGVAGNLFSAYHHAFPAGEEEEGVFHNVVVRLKCHSITA